MTVPDRQFCSEQMARLSGLPGYPKTEEAKREFIDTLQGAFSFVGGGDVLRQWVTDVLHEVEFCPSQADAWRAGHRLRPAKQQPHCRQCDGTGWRPVIKYGVECVERCVCQPRAAVMAARLPYRDSEAE